MNKVVLCGRLVRDPDVRYSQGDSPMAIARYTLAVDRKFKKNNEASSDFIPCVAMGKQGEFAERYLKKGTKVIVSGRIQTGSYTNRDGQKVYTTDIYIEEQEFAESKNANNQEGNNQAPPKEAPANAYDRFMDVPDSLDGEGLPFN